MVTKKCIHLFALLNLLKEKGKRSVLKLGTNPVEDIESVKRVFSQLRARTTKMEIVVLFCSSSNQDHVKSYGRYLARHVNEQGQPTAGLQIEVSEHLGGVFADLISHAYVLRQTHGAGLRCSIKFEEEELSFVMVVQLPNSSEWLRVDGDLAREEMNRWDAERRDTVMDRLSSTDLIGKHSEINSIIQENTMK